MLRNGITGQPRTIYRERHYGNLGTVNWSPDGRELMIDQAPDSGRYDLPLIITTTGRIVRQLPVLRPYPDGLAWGPEGLAVGNGFHSGPNELLNLSGRIEHKVPGGWIPMCWNPAGTAMIVFHPKDEIGLWRLASQVQDLGRSPMGALGQCVWLSRPAAGT